MNQTDKTIQEKIYNTQHMRQDETNNIMNSLKIKSSFFTSFTIKRDFKSILNFKILIQCSTIN